MFKKILLAYDGSATSVRALQYAQDLALKYNAGIVVLHAYALLPVEFLSPSVEQVQTEVIAASDRILKEAQAKLEGKGVAITAELVQGPPAAAILDAVKKYACDLIILGSRGLGEITGILLGSVSNKVLHHSTIPVLVIK